MLIDYLLTSREVIGNTIQSLDSKKVRHAIISIRNCLKKKKALLVCGNGGSASDAMHITGELVGKFYKERKALKVICLSSNPAVITAWANDYHYSEVFLRQVDAYGEKGGVLLGLSTSGNSINVIKAFERAKTIGMTTIALTGQGGGYLASVSDILLDVPSTVTPLIQQVHVCLYHYICQEVEARFA